jgi:hypothetical protein
MQMFFAHPLRRLLRYKKCRLIKIWEIDFLTNGDNFRLIFILSSRLFAKLIPKLKNYLNIFIFFVKYYSTSRGNCSSMRSKADFMFYSHP